MPEPCKYVGVEGEKCDRLMDLLSQTKASKPKRVPSTYNLYVKACLTAKGGVKKFGEAGPMMRQCAIEYKEDKGKGKFRYNVPEPPAEAGRTLWKGRDLLKEWGQLHRKVSGTR